MEIRYVVRITPLSEFANVFCRLVCNGPINSCHSQYTITKSEFGLNNISRFHTSGRKPAYIHTSYTHQKRQWFQTSSYEVSEPYYKTLTYNCCLFIFHLFLILKILEWHPMTSCTVSLIQRWTTGCRRFTWRFHFSAVTLQQRKAIWIFNYDAISRNWIENIIMWVDTLCVFPNSCCEGFFKKYSNLKIKKN